MALAFPRTDIIPNLRIADGYLMPQWRQQMSSSPARTIVKDLAPMLWRASYTTGTLTHDQAAEVEADLLTLQGGLKYFHGYDPRRPAPKNAPDFEFDTLTLNDIRSDRLGMRISGLPFGFVIAKGDYVSIKVSGGGFHLVRAATDAQAVGPLGVSGWFDVAPGLHPSVAVGATVVLRFAGANFMIEPGGISAPQSVGLFECRISFTAMQVFG